MALAAKRHHWVPRFLLRAFSPEPAAKNPLVARLDKKSGQTTTSSINNEAVIGHFNRLETPMEGPWDSVEDGWATIEDQCKPALDKVRAGDDLDLHDFQLIVLFTELQHRRTPRMRQWAVELMEPIAQAEAQIAVGKIDPEKIRRWLQERHEEPVTDEQIEKYRSEILDQLRDEKLKVKASADHEVLAPFVAAGEVAIEISRQMTLSCLQAPAGAEFILGDHPVSIIDPSIPWDRGVGWLSSPNARVTFPISRTTCLEFRPGRPGHQYVQASPDKVQDVNLRSYAHAEWAVWGAGPKWVQQTRAAAKSDKLKLASYKPRKLHLFFLERMEGSADPHKVTVHQPTEPTIRGFIRRRK